jgi:hypothetical protein
VATQSDTLAIELPVHKTEGCLCPSCVRAFEQGARAALEYIQALQEIP